MKKFLALALTLALALALSISVFATRIIGDPDGVPSFEKTTFDNLINITVTTGQVQSRYAIDLEFDAFTIEVSGSVLTWDVNNLVYVNTSGAASGLNIDNRPVKIYNYSDKPVYVQATCTDADGADGIDIAINGTEDSVAFDIRAALVGSEPKDDRRGTGSFTVSVTSENWTDVANYYARDLQDGSEKVGQIDITISPVAFVTP